MDLIKPNTSFCSSHDDLRICLVSRFSALDCMRRSKIASSSEFLVMLDFQSGKVPQQSARLQDR